MRATARERASIHADLRGASRVATDATLLLTRLVETMHHNILRTPGVLGRATFAPTRGITGLVYKSVRGVTRLVGTGVDVSLAALQPLLAVDGSWKGRDTVLAVLNGVLGDYLEGGHNPLAIEMQLRHDGMALDPARESLASALPQATGKVVVLVHGLCMSDKWTRKGHDHGRELAQDLGYTPIYVRYNSGLHISVNGRQLAAMLEPLITNWPVPIEDFVIIGHSMGGLVARSAVHYARRGRRVWPKRLRRLVFLGAPHHGAPLERGGAWLDVLFRASPYTAAFNTLGRTRSAGITDLRHGSLLDEDREGVSHRFRPRPDRRQVVPLPAGVACYAIAGVAGESVAGAKARLIGDGLVPLASALGRHREASRTLAFPESHQWVGERLGHLELLSSHRVYRHLRHWLAETAPGADREIGRQPIANGR